MKRVMFKTIFLASVLLGASSAFAIPRLQLDIEGGTYDASTQTIVASSSSFTLYALLTPTGNSQQQTNLLADTYWISMSVSPQVSTPSNLGSFTFESNTINVTNDMIYGTPPLSGTDPGDLAGHGVFPTYFQEYSFQFQSTQNTASYDAQSAFGGTAGGLDTAGTGAYYMAFSVNTSGLSEPYIVHFDLYNTKAKNGDVDVDNFAPFSHDAQSAPVPEPTTMLLFGTGLLGLAAVGRRRR